MRSGGAEGGFRMGAPLTDRDLATARGRSIEGMEECQCTLAMRFSFGLRGMTCRYRNRKTSAPLCVMVRRMNRFISGSITGRGRENGQCGAGELFPTTAWRCSRKVILVSSSVGAARSRREGLVSLQTHGGRVQRKWRMNRRPGGQLGDEDTGTLCGVLLERRIFGVAIGIRLRGRTKVLSPSALTLGS